MVPIIVYEAPAERKVGSPPDAGFLQYKNVCPTLVGVGAVIIVPYDPELDAGLTEPPFASHVTV
jgi:hypothetical protein